MNDNAVQLIVARSCPALNTGHRRRMTVSACAVCELCDMYKCGQSMAIMTNESAKVTLLSYGYHYKARAENQGGSRLHVRPSGPH